MLLHMGKDVRFAVFVLAIFCGAMAMFSFDGWQEKPTTALTPDLNTQRGLIATTERMRWVGGRMICSVVSRLRVVG